MNKIILLRHGEALHNVIPQAWHLGDENMLTLTEKGYRQATDAALKIKSQLNLTSDSSIRIVSSSLTRAVQTRKLVINTFNQQGVKCTEVQDIRETALHEFYSVFDGKPPEGFDFDSFMKDPFKKKFDERNKISPWALKVRNPWDMMVLHLDLLKQISGTEKSEEPTIVIGHHFNLNVLRLLALLIHVCGIALVNRMVFLMSTGVHPESICKLQPIVTAAMTSPLPNAEPTDLLSMEWLAEDEDPFVEKVRRWNEAYAKTFVLNLFD